ncbi:MAG: hypothetical protein IPK82_21735 [Polyangiaceae bacterium]|nr:hypothetical protein [Polyangiaceae bacterium]
MRANWIHPGGLGVGRRLQEAAKRAWIVLLPVLFATACSDESETVTGGTGGSTTTSETGGVPLDPEAFLEVPKSCAFECPDPAGCSEKSAPYQCAAMGEWSAIGHVDTCAEWDGTYPSAVTGQCEATAPTAAALLRPGVDQQDPTAYLLPDGRRSKPAGAVWAFDEPDLLGGNTSGIAAVPGTPFVITVDTGPDDHALRVVDTTKIGSGINPVVSLVEQKPPNGLNSGIAIVQASRVYVATAYGVVLALTLDTATGVIAKDDAATLQLPPQSPGIPLGMHRGWRQARMGRSWL